MKKIVTLFLLFILFFSTAIAQNAAPTAVILQPKPGDLYKPLTTVTVEGYGTDSDADQQTPLQYDWRVERWSNGNVAFITEVRNQSGYPVNSGYFYAGDPEYIVHDDFYRVHFKVTDMHGAQDSTYVDVYHNHTSLVILQSNPNKLKMSLDGETVTTIHADTSEIGSARVIAPISPQTLNGVTYAFSNWTHGGPATQTIITPEINTIYRANFSSPLVGSWRTTDVGMVNVPGSASHDLGIFRLTGSGKDIWEKADAFRYIYQTVEGNVDIRARVDRMSYSHYWAKAGVMIRNSMDPRSKHAMTVITPSNGASFQRRMETGGSSVGTGAAASTPYWVRLVRYGDTFTSYISANGTDWTKVGTQTISMYNRVYVGMVVTSHTTNNTVCLATMTNVSVSSSVAMAAAQTTQPKENEDEFFTVYPNPVSGNTLYIRLKENVRGQLQIVNTLGQVHHEEILNSTQVEVPLSTIPKGVYLVRVAGGAKTWVKSIVRH
jgi:regulation of enolase protein 1 (concanavalin A-like superfamily)